MYPCVSVCVYLYCDLDEFPGGHHQQCDVDSLEEGGATGAVPAGLSSCVTFVREKKNNQIQGAKEGVFFLLPHYSPLSQGLLLRRRRHSRCGRYIFAFYDTITNIVVVFVRRASSVHRRRRRSKKVLTKRTSREREEEGERENKRVLEAGREFLPEVC